MMQKAIFTSLLALSGYYCNAQNWDGTYRLGDPNIKESSLGMLEIKQLSDKEIRFTLQFSDHGQKASLTGKVSVDAAKMGVYFSETGGKGAPCSLILQLSGQEILITQESSAQSCGFAAGLDISGTYHQISKSSTLK